METDKTFCGKIALLEWLTCIEGEGAEEKGNEGHRGSRRAEKRKPWQRQTYYIDYNRHKLREQRRDRGMLQACKCYFIDITLLQFAVWGGKCLLWQKAKLYQQYDSWNFGPIFRHVSLPTLDLIDWCTHKHKHNEITLQLPLLLAVNLNLVTQVYASECMTAFTASTTLIKQQ